VVIDNCVFKTTGRSPAIYGNGNHTISNCTFSGERATNVELVEAEGSIIKDNNKMNAASVQLMF
jgi:hypothetical protein